MSKGLFSALLPAVGTAAGAAIGGPPGALIGAELGSSIGGALASQQAADQQSAAAQAAIAEQQRQFNVTQANLAPYRQAGYSALNQMMKMMGLGPLAVPAMPAATPTSGGGGGGNSNLENFALASLISPGLGAAAAIPALKSAYQNMSSGEKGGLFGGIFDMGSGVGDVLSGLGLAHGGPAHGGSHGKTYVVGEEGPEILHMDPGSHGFVEPNPHTVMRAMEGRAYGGPVGGAIGEPSVPEPMGNNPNLNLYRPPVNQRVPVPGTPTTQPVAAPQSTNPAVPTPFNPTGGNNTALTGGMTPAQIMRMDPGYQFRLQQGIRAMDMSAAASGGLLTGGHLRALEQYGQGYASQEFGNIYSRLAALAAGGQGAAVNSGYMGQGSANAIGGYLTNQGNALAGGTMGSYNALSQGLGNLAFLYGQGAFNSTPAVPSATGPFNSLPA